MLLGDKYVFIDKKVAEHLPIGTVYAVWTGIGAAGTVLVGIFVLRNLLIFGVCFLFQRLLFQ